MKIQLPDGTTLDAPEGSDPKKVVAGYKAHQASKKTPESPTSFGNLTGAALEPMLAMGTGAVAVPVSGLAGLGAEATRALGITAADPADVVRKVGGAMTYQPKTTGGQNAMKVFGAPGDVLSQIVPALVEQGYRDPEMASFGDETVGTVSPEMATILDTAIQGAGQLGLAKGAGKLSDAGSLGLRSKVSPQVRDLARRGVTMTPGQRAGGMRNRLEQGLSSIPVVGDFVKNARGKSVEQFSRATVNDALQEVGATLPKDVRGHEAIAEAQRILSEKYDTLLPTLKGDLNTGLKVELDAVKQQGASLPAQQLKDLTRIVDQEIAGKFDAGGKITGDALKRINETLNKEINQYKRGDAYQRQLADALKQAKESVDRMVRRENPQAAAELKKIDSAYARFKIAQKAAVAAGKDGVFTPAQYLRAIRARDLSKDKSAFAKGKALNQPLGKAGEEILGNTLPDSGTPYRSMEALGLLGTAGGFAAGHTPAGLGAGLAIPGIYNQPVLRGLQSLSLMPGTPVGTAAATALPVGAAQRIDQNGVAQ
jgi:exonuclease VII small subunit